jgi:macrodomain Ter protein organizer (MatP/YcbG family)
MRRLGVRNGRYFEASAGRDARAGGNREKLRRVPFKSRAQRRKFAELLVKGEISPETFEEWNRETGSAKLPERVKPTTRAKSKTRPKTRTRTKTRTKPRPRRKARA